MKIPDTVLHLTLPGSTVQLAMLGDVRARRFRSTDELIELASVFRFIGDQVNSSVTERGGKRGRRLASFSLTTADIVRMPSLYDGRTPTPARNATRSRRRSESVIPSLPTTASGAGACVLDELERWTRRSAPFTFGRPT